MGPKWAARPPLQRLPAGCGAGMAGAHAALQLWTGMPASLATRLAAPNFPCSPQLLHDWPGKSTISCCNQFYSFELQNLAITFSLTIHSFHPLIPAGASCLVLPPGTHSVLSSLPAAACAALQLAPFVMCTCSGGIYVTAPHCTSASSTDCARGGGVTPCCSLLLLLFCSGCMRRPV